MLGTRKAPGYVGEGISCRQGAGPVGRPLHLGPDTASPDSRTMLRRPRLQVRSSGGGAGEGGTAGGMQGRWEAWGGGCPSIRKHPSMQKKGPGSSMQEGLCQPGVRKIDAWWRQWRAGAWPPGPLPPQVIRLMGR